MFGGEMNTSIGGMRIFCG